MKTEDSPNLPARDLVRGNSGTSSGSMEKADKMKGSLVSSLKAITGQPVSSRINESRKLAQNNLQPSLKHCRTTNVVSIKNARLLPSHSEQVSSQPPDSNRKFTETSSVRSPSSVNQSTQPKNTSGRAALTTDEYKTFSLSSKSDLNILTSRLQQHLHKHNADFLGETDKNHSLDTVSALSEGEDREENDRITAKQLTDIAERLNKLTDTIAQYRNRQEEEYESIRKASEARGNLKEINKVDRHFSGKINQLNADIELIDVFKSQLIGQSAVLQREEVVNKVAKGLEWLMNGQEKSITIGVGIDLGLKIGLGEKLRFNLISGGLGISLEKSTSQEHDGYIYELTNKSGKIYLSAGDNHLLQLQGNLVGTRSSGKAFQNNRELAKYHAEHLVDILFLSKMFDLFKSDTYRNFKDARQLGNEVETHLRQNNKLVDLSRLYGLIDTKQSIAKADIDSGRYFSLEQKSSSAKLEGKALGIFTGEYQLDWAKKTLSGFVHIAEAMRGNDRETLRLIADNTHYCRHFLPDPESSTEGNHRAKLREVTGGEAAAVLTELYREINAAAERGTEIPEYRAQEILRQARYSLESNYVRFKTYRQALDHNQPPLAAPATERWRGADNIKRGIESETHFHIANKFDLAPGAFKEPVSATLAMTVNHIANEGLYRKIVDMHPQLADIAFEKQLDHEFKSAFTDTSHIRDPKDIEKHLWIKRAEKENSEWVYTKYLGVEGSIYGLVPIGGNMKQQYTIRYDHFENDPVNSAKTTTFQIMLGANAKNIANTIISSIEGEDDSDFIESSLSALELAGDIMGTKKLQGTYTTGEYEGTCRNIYSRHEKDSNKFNLAPGDQGSLIVSYPYKDKNGVVTQKSQELTSKQLQDESIVNVEPQPAGRGGKRIKSILLPPQGNFSKPTRLTLNHDNNANNIASIEVETSVWLDNFSEYTLSLAVSPTTKKSLPLVPGVNVTGEYGLATYSSLAKIRKLGTECLDDATRKLNVLMQLALNNNDNKDWQDYIKNNCKVLENKLPGINHKSRMQKLFENIATEDSFVRQEVNEMAAEIDAWLEADTKKLLERRWNGPEAKENGAFAVTDGDIEREDAKKARVRKLLNEAGLDSGGATTRQLAAALIRGCTDNNGSQVIAEYPEGLKDPFARSVKQGADQADDRLYLFETLMMCKCAKE